MTAMLLCSIENTNSHAVLQSMPNLCVARCGSCGCPFCVQRFRIRPVLEKSSYDFKLLVNRAGRSARATGSYCEVERR